MREKLLVIARHYTEDEEFWLGYRCRKCGLRYESIQEIQKHALTHQTIRLEWCPECGKLAQIQEHHIDYKKDIKKRMCPACHGKWHARFTPKWGTKDMDLSKQAENYFSSIVK